MQKHRKNVKLKCFLNTFMMSATYYQIHQLKEFVLWPVGMFHFLTGCCGSRGCLTPFSLYLTSNRHAGIATKEVRNVLLLRFKLLKSS